MVALPPHQGATTPLPVLGQMPGWSRAGAAGDRMHPGLQLCSGLAVSVTHLGQQVPQLSLALQVPQPWSVRAGHIHNQVVSQRAQHPHPSHIVSCSISGALVLAQVDSKGHPRWNTGMAEPGQQDQPPPKGPECSTKEGPGPAKIKMRICSPYISQCGPRTVLLPQLPCSVPPGTVALPSETAQLGTCGSG